MSLSYSGLAGWIWAGVGGLPQACWPSSLLFQTVNSASNRLTIFCPSITHVWPPPCLWSAMLPDTFFPINRAPLPHAMHHDEYGWHSSEQHRYRSAHSEPAGQQKREIKLMTIVSGHRYVYSICTWHSWELLGRKCLVCEKDIVHPGGLHWGGGI